MVRTPKKTAPEEEEKDPFIEKIQREIEKLLDNDDDPKGKNATIANAIKFLVVRNKLQGGDDDGWFGND
jgi:hypothetical protein